jgi:hypothetical protein
MLQKARHQAGVCTPPPSDGWYAGGFRISFIPLPGCFSPFPHGTRSLSVTDGIEPWAVGGPASHTVPRHAWYSRPERLLALWRVAYGTLTPSGRRFHAVRLQPETLLLQGNPQCGRSTTLGRTTPAQDIGPPPTQSPPVWAPPRSLATTWGIISSPRGTEMFQFPRFPSRI